MAMELVQPNEEIRTEPRDDLAVMLTGGGARAAYQVGVIKGLARHFPDLRFQIITGVSAGAINAIFLAAHDGPLRESADDLANLWCSLECRHVFRPNYAALLPFRTAFKAILPPRMSKRPHGLLNAGPLAETLRGAYHCPIRNQPIDGIRRNLARGDLKAVGLIGLDYTTGQSVRWTQGRDIDAFEGPNRRSVQTEITVEHVLASASLPFVFPAVKIEQRWYGDGGIRLAAPLSSAVHLGARRILAMSTGYQRTPDEANTPVLHGYPPAAQIMGQLINAIFLDVIDEDVTRMERMNEMISKLDASQRNGFKAIDLFVMRPSLDLGRLAGEHEKYLPRNMKLLTRALGTRETESPDFISMLMFEPHYTTALIKLGENDVASRLDEFRLFLGEPAAAISAV
ncbi:MAG: patatin-like phospholipase family protein [Acidobacteria bacterium]|nr:patatin-like phospholipase family protein [Acidobacteriota bacterium]MBV9187774.1 patatin-like phospholipase family protein [Acidobacteriota bacterium]